MTLLRPDAVPEEYQMAHWRPYLGAVWKLASYSHDPRTQNAALILDAEGHLLSTGINGFPRGVQETIERWQEKKAFVEHAERDALYRAAKRGVALQDATMVCGWAACSDCARGIIASGIKTLVRHEDATLRSRVKWQINLALADMMLLEAGIQIINIAGPVGNCAVRHDGIMWTP